MWARGAQRLGCVSLVSVCSTEGSSLSGMVLALRSNSHLTFQNFKRMKNRIKVSLWLPQILHLCKTMSFSNRTSMTGARKITFCCHFGSSGPLCHLPCKSQTTPPLDWFSAFPSLRSLIVRSIFKYFKICFIGPWVSICLCECMCTCVRDYACLCRYTG